jgi:folylpolyglutamate synthase/dihydropteroate synthase
VIEDVETATVQAWRSVDPDRAGAGADRGANDDEDPATTDGVIVTGSLYTVGAARRACRHQGLLDD